MNPTPEQLKAREELLEAAGALRSIAEPNTILRGTVGSKALGLSLDGADDSDELGVCIEPPDCVIGLGSFEQWVYRTKPEGVRSGPGDLDLTVYSLRKFCRLAAQGNPSILILLYLPSYLSQTEEGSELVARRSMFSSKDCGRRFLGYLTSQKMRLVGGEARSMRANRPELVAKHGYDTKYAYHVARLGFQGVEFMETGGMALPMTGECRDFCMAIRRGELKLAAVLERCSVLEHRLNDLIKGGSELPNHPDRDEINRYLVGAYMEHWK